MSRLLDSLPDGATLPEIIGIVVNEKGLERALATPGVSTIGYPYSISAYFRRANANMTRAESRALVETLKRETKKANKDLVIYISMAFGNPYGDPWDADEVLAAVDILEVSGIKMISLADTVGMASPGQIQALVSAVIDKFGYLEIGAHLHSRPDAAAEKVLAAYAAGCRRFDSAIAGLGGCPFAQDALVGNIPTEKLLEALAQAGAELPPLKPLDTLLRASTEIGARYGVSHAAD
jgi:hydroxymethylglutaryl-CoA lyase